ALRFAYSTGSAENLAIFSRDGAGRASVYFPSDGSTSRSVQAGQGQGLPESTVLDDTLGQETLYGIFCEQPFAIAPVRRALESGDPLPVAESCKVDRVSVDKRAAP